jgi:hypothetical protein
MVFGIGEKKASDRMAMEAAYNAPSAGHPEAAENNLEKNATIPAVKRAAKELTDIDGWVVAGAAAGIITGTGPIAGIVVAKVGDAIHGYLEEKREAEGQQVTAQDKPTEKMNGVWAGGAAGLMTFGPVGAVVGAGVGWVASEILQNKEETQLKEQQADLAVAQASATYNAGMMDGAANNIVQFKRRENWAETVGAKKGITPQDIIAQREQQAVLEPQR